MNTRQNLSSRLSSEEPERSPRGQKRCRTPSESPTRRVRVRNLPTYYGKTIEEAQAFISGAERRFRLSSEYNTDQQRIDYCVLAFADKPARIWDQYEKDIEEEGVAITWAQFKEWVVDTVRDPITRKLRAAMEYEEIRQGDEGVDDFARALDTLERELGYKDENQRANTLFAKLRPNLRRHVLFAGVPPTSRQELLRLVRRIESTDKISKEAPNRTRNPSEKECKICKSDEHWSNQCPRATCFRCQGKGHFARYCQVKL
jgi:hypothetical protein